MRSLRVVLIGALITGFVVTGSVSASSVGGAKKRCKVVTRVVHGKKKRVRVCHGVKSKPRVVPPTVKPPPPPPPSPPPPVGTKSNPVPVGRTTQIDENWQLA